MASKTVQDMSRDQYKKLVKEKQDAIVQVSDLRKALREAIIRRNNAELALDELKEFATNEAFPLYINVTVQDDDDDLI